MWLLSVGIGIGKESDGAEVKAIARCKTTPSRPHSTSHRLGQPGPPPLPLPLPPPPSHPETHTPTHQQGPPPLPCLSRRTKTDPEKYTHIQNPGKSWAVPPTLTHELGPFLEDPEHA